MWYAPVDPPDRLRHLLACSWIAHPSGTHLLTPDGCTDLLLLSSGRLIYCGPEVRSWTFSLLADVTAVGVRFLPGAAHAVFGLDLHSVFDQRVPFSRIVSDDSARSWEAALRGVVSLPERRDALVDLVAAHRPNATLPDAAAQIVATLTADPFATTAQLAAATRLHPRTLQRRSRQWFGDARADHPLPPLPRHRLDDGGPTVDGIRGGRGGVLRPAPPRSRLPGDHRYVAHPVPGDSLPDVPRHVRSVQDGGLPAAMLDR